MSREEEGYEETGGGDEVSLPGSGKNDEGWMGVGLEWPGYLPMEAEIGDSLPPTTTTYRQVWFMVAIPQLRGVLGRASSMAQSSCLAMAIRSRSELSTT